MARLTERHREYWRRNISLTLFLLAILVVVTWVMAYFSRELAAYTIRGWPLPFYMSAQGSLIVYVALIWYYCKKMRELDKEYGVSEGEDE